MFQAPPLLLTLSLTILHSHFYNAVPIGEEQRHQAIHPNPHDSSAYPSEVVDHQDVSSLPRSQHDNREGNEESESTQMHPPNTSDEGDELFKDISPKALAAVLLQALNSDGEEQTPSTLAERTPSEDHKALKDEKDDGQTERVRSRSQSLEKEEGIREDAKMGDEEDLESVKSLLQELESFQPPPKPEQTEQNTIPVNDDLEELKELLGIGNEIEEEKRTPIQPDSESSRRWDGEEESENLAGVAQDLLLQYVLNGGGDEGEQDEEEKNQDEEEGEEADDYQGGDFAGGQKSMLEDEEDANVQEKRSNDDDDDEVDPQTIDKLIELSSRLHLPADDVVDIITDVEKRRRRRMKKKKARDDYPGRKERTRAPPQSWDTPKPAYYPRRRLEQEPVWNKVQDPVWNRVQEPIWSKKKEPRWNNWAEPRWNKVQQPSWNKVQQPSWNKVQQPSWNKVQQPNWKKMQDPSWNKVQQPSWNKVQEPSWNKVQEPSWNKVQEPSWNKVQDLNWNKVPDSSWNEIEKPSWNKIQKSSWDNMQDSSWNKVKQPSWRKVMEPPPRRYRTRPASFPNYMRPRAFQSPPRYYYKPPPPQIDDYFDEDKDRQEEMENYIERLLLTHPEVFQ
ncbi:hypothetical protein XENTR_v10010162 [Xenopus tropicalis]|nr:hypothetical protein XENTR_v10010162 [Xenopus tropicalis]